MALIDDFKARFPGFATASVDSLFPALAIAWPAYYGGTYTDAATEAGQLRENEAILNLLAHLFVMEEDSESGAYQQESSYSIDGVSASFAVGMQSTGISSDMFRATKYGQRFMAITASNYGGQAV